MKKITVWIVLSLAILLSGCAGTVKNMRELPADAVVAPPKQDEALVVFMRPSGLGFAVQSSVYEIVSDKPVLAGIVAAKTKVAYRTKPGTRLFMTLGENADFMTADLQPNKTYYAYVAPRMGAWKARFVFEPKTAKDLESAEFKSDFETCKWVEVSDESLRWLSENMSSIQSLRIEYYQDRLKQPANERSRLLANDGK